MPVSTEVYGFHFRDLHKMHTYQHLSALGGYLLHWISPNVVKKHGKKG